MKICIPTLEAQGHEATISGHFGSAPYFTLFDTEQRTTSSVANGHTEHGHGMCMPVDILKAHGVDAVLCKGMGARAVSLLLSAGIEPLIVNGGTVAEAIREFETGQAVRMDVAHACQHHDCQ